MSGLFGRWMTWLAAIALWAGAFLFAFTAPIHNDHFDRIVHARQVARYGELPFRDFLDPGYFMTEFVSAGLQRILGDRLLGDLLLDASFIATGTVIVLLLARRVSGSLLAGCVASLLALLAVPRLYDFDKVLFYPLGVLLCWRYVERTTPRNLALLGAGVVAGALFRYDTGLYVGASAAVAVLVAHWHERGVAVRRLARLAAVVAIAALPFLVFIQLTAGLATAADQIATYAIREGARTRISSPPRFSFGTPANVTVRIRWAPAVDDGERRALAESYGLRDETLAGDPGERTWAYRLEDASAANVRRLVSDPRVEDTHGIDRTQAAPAGDPAWTPGAVIERWTGLRVLPEAWTPANAAALIYYLLLALPALGAIALLAEPADGRRVQAARVLSLAVMCVVLNVFILRDPIAARIGGMGGPAAVMAAWVAARAWRTRRVLVRAAAVAAIAVVVWAVSASADWPNEFRNDRLSRARIENQYRAVATPAGDVMPYGPWFGIVTYLRDCTLPDDRVYASWFVPEIYFYARRGFAAGVSVTFGGHWSEPRYQELMVDRLSVQSVPIVLIHQPSYADFRTAYPLVDRYLQEHYDVAGETDFGDSEAGPGAYRVLTRTDRTPSGTHAASSMPCFGPPRLASAHASAGQPPPPDRLLSSDR